MHNGDITDFSKVRRGPQHQLRDDLFDHMSGTTDSELLFLLILNRLPDCHTQQDPATLQQAVLDAFCAVIQANRGKANSLNIAFTDGETTIATRYRNSDVEEPPSLYYHVGPMPGESAWDLNNADLGRSTPWRRIRTCTTTAARSRPRATRRREPERTGTQRDEGRSSWRRRHCWCPRSRSRGKG